MTWGRLPEPGDWVKLTRLVPLTLTDHALGTGLRPGTSGVVNDRTGDRVNADFDTGTGTVTASVDTDSCRVVRRNGGHHQFKRRSRVKLAARAALTLWLTWPVAAFAVVYVWTHGSFDGLTVALVVAAFDSLGDWAVLLAAHPLRTVVYLAFLALLGRLAL